MPLEDSTSPSATRRRGTVESLWWPTVRVGLLLLAVLWWSSILVRLGSLDRAALANASVLLPGTTSLPDARVETAGSWVVQRVGETSFVATRNKDDVLRFTFVGTEVALTLRVGPDAGRIAARVQPSADGSIATRPVEIQLDLTRSRARVVDAVLADGLVPGKYDVEVHNLDTAELAVSAIVVANRPGIWWAWIAPAGIALLALVPALEMWWRALTSSLGWSLDSEGGP